MKKKVIAKTFELQKAQWVNFGWWIWMALCLFCFCLPVFSFPLQFLITSMGKAILSPIPVISNWAVRHFDVYTDNMFLVACSDCGRIFFISCIVALVLEFLYAFITIYIKE